MWLLFLAAALVASSSQANALASTPSDAANVQNFPDENVGFRESHSLSLAQQELVLPQPDIRHTRWPISPFALAAPVAVVVFLIFYCALRLMRTNNYTTTTQRRRLASEESGPCSPLGDKGPDSDPLMKTEAYSPHKKQLGKLLLTSEDAMCLTLEEKLSVADARKILGDLLNEIELLEAQLDSLGSKHRSLQKMLELPPEHGGPETSSQKDTMQIMLQETLDKMEEVKSNLQGRKRRANTMIWTTGQTTQELLLWARYFGMGRLLSPSAAAAFAARDVVFGASGDKQTVLLDEVAKVSVKSLVQHLIDEGNACTDLLSRDAFPSDEEVDRAKRSLRDLTSLVPQLGLVEPAYGLSGQLERTTEALKSLEAAMVKWQELLSSQNPTSRIDVQPSGYTQQLGAQFTGPGPHAAPPISPPSSASATTKPPTPLPPMQDEPPPPRPAVTMPGPVEPPATQDPSPGVALPPAQTPASPIQLQSDSPSAEGRAQTPPVPAAAPMTAPVPAVSATSLTSPSAGSDALAPPWAYILSDPRDLPPHASLSSSGFAAEEALLPPSSLGSSSSGDARESEAALPAAVQLPSSTGDEAQHSEEATSEEDKQQSEPEGLPHPPPDISTADAGLGEEWPPPPSEAEFDEMEGPSGDDHSAGEPPPPPPPEDGQQQPGDSPAPPGEPSSPPGGQSAPPGDDPPPPGQPPVPQGKPSEEGGLDANEEIKELIDKLSDFVLTASSVEASLQSNAKHLKEAEGLFTSGTALIQLAKGHTPSPTADPTVMSELEHQLGKCSETCSSLQESCRSWQEKLSDRTLGLSLKIEETQDGWRKPSSELPTLGFVSCIEELVNAAKEVETLFEHLKLLEGPFAEALDLKETLTTASEAISAAKEEASLAASHCASVYRKTLQKGSFVGSEGAGPGPGPLGGEYPMLETAKSVSTRLGALGLGGEALQALGEAVSKIEVTRL
ncbi:hypothetical protein, conserved [Eimeria praecox]|uniref:Myosin heavy chain n=1 Tax=Eimeria praecox TaxID=51316 RepID=U6H5N8_9EIME|nr:hypothetical protein, conserved [Eimeria praecox]